MIFFLLLLLLICLYVVSFWPNIVNWFDIFAINITIEYIQLLGAVLLIYTVIQK